MIHRETSRVSQVPGEPWCTYAVFFDPGGTSVPGPYGTLTRPPDRPSRRLAAGKTSRGSVARRSHALSTLREDPHGPPRKTHFRLRARLYRVGLVTHKVPAKGFEEYSLHPPLLSRASWRKVGSRSQIDSRPPFELDGNPGA